jgi:hypothetical protein
MSGPEREKEMREMAREILRELVPEMPAMLGAAAGGNGHRNGSDTERSDGSHRNGHSAGHGNGSHSGHGAAGRAGAFTPEGAVVPQVPAPPVAAVLRPSTWGRPAGPGEIIGSAAPARAADSVPDRAPTARPQPRPAAGPQPSPASRPAPRPQPRPAAHPQPSPAPGRERGPARPLAQPGGDGRVEVIDLDTDEELALFIRQLMSRLENPRERLAIRTGKLRFRLRRSSGVAAPAAAGPVGPVTRVEKGAVTERMIRAAAAEGTRLVLAPGAVLTPLAREQARARGVEIETERRC